MQYEKLIRHATMAGLGVLAIVSLFVGLRNGIVNHVDFQWMPAKIMMLGENPYLHSLNHLPWRAWTQIDANQIPSCLLLLAPWTLLDYPVANTCWAFCNIGFTFVFCFYLYRTFFAEEAPIPVKSGFLWVVLLLLSGLPLRVLIGNGQHLMFSMAFFMPALFYALKKREVVAGILMALCFFKYTTVAPMCLIFVAIGSWKAITIGAGLHILATIGSGVWLHENPLTLVKQSLEVGAMLTGGGRVDIVSALRMSGVAGASRLALPCYVIFGALSLAVTMAGAKNMLLKLATLTMIGNVMFYHREYDFISLVIPLIYAVSLIGKGGLRKLDKLTVALIFFDVAFAFYGFKACELLRIKSLTYVWLWPILEHVVTFCLCCKLLATSLSGNAKQY